MTEKYILASLNEDKSKDLAKVISNETSRKILNILSEKDRVSPKELSKELDIPINTVMYNLKQLKQHGTLLRGGFHDFY